MGSQHRQGPSSDFGGLWQTAGEVLAGQSFPMDVLDVLINEEIEDLGEEVAEETGAGATSGLPVKKLFGPSLVDEELEVDFAYPERLIRGKDPDYPGFTGFFACNWNNGMVYPFSSSSARVRTRAPASPLSSPTTRMVHQKYVGTENMRSTYRVLASFAYSSEVTTANGTAILLSPHRLVTAAHLLNLTTIDTKTNSKIVWELKEVKIYGGEFVPSSKVEDCGYRCKVLGKPECSWGTSKECPSSGSDIAFLEVTETLPCFLLPCSPKLGIPLVAFGYPGALAFLRRAVRELKEETGNTIWVNYWTILWDDIRQYAERHRGDLASAEKAMKSWLLDQFRTILRGIPEGAQTASAGFVEALTGCFIGHTCPSLPGLSGGCISPLECPGYLTGCQTGALDINQNIATSTDNSVFVSGYMVHILPDLPDPDWEYYQRPYFSLAPFRAWLEKHEGQVPSSSNWAGPQRKKRKLTSGVITCLSPLDVSHCPADAKYNQSITYGQVQGTSKFNT